MGGGECDGGGKGGGGGREGEGGGGGGAGLGGGEGEGGGGEGEGGGGEGEGGGGEDEGGARFGAVVSASPVSTAPCWARKFKSRLSCASLSAATRATMFATESGSAAPAAPP